MPLDAVIRLATIPVRISASGPVAPAAAWERYENLDLWPTWSPQLQRVDAVPRRLLPGLGGRVVGPLGVSAGFTVADVEPTSFRWSWTVRRRPLEVTLEHGIDADPGAAAQDAETPGSRAWLVLRGPAPVVLTYAPVAWYALHRLVTLPVPA